VKASLNSTLHFDLRAKERRDGQLCSSSPFIPPPAALSLAEEPGIGKLLRPSFLSSTSQAHLDVLPLPELLRAALTARRTETPTIPETRDPTRKRKPGAARRTPEAAEEEEEGGSSIGGRREPEEGEEATKRV